MSNPRVTLLQKHSELLEEWLPAHPDGHERAAVVLFRKFNRRVDSLAQSDRFVSIEVHLLAGDWITDSSTNKVKVNLRKFVDLYFRCETEQLELGFVHSHPDGHKYFSAQDDQNEINILQGYSGCNGPDVSLVSLIFVDHSWIGRIRQAVTPLDSQPVKHVLCLGDQIRINLPDNPGPDNPTLLRQAAAFGEPFNRQLQSLRIVVVGCGGTGSPTATLLARTGVGEIVLVDGDNLELTNLNRVRGFSTNDVGQNKAESLAVYIRSLGLPTSVSSIPSNLGDDRASIDAISSCDVVIGCTDTVLSRDLLNQAVYYYGVTLIDCGLTGGIKEDGDGIPRLFEHRGRVSTVQPETGACLRCQAVVTDEKLRYETAIKEKPELALLDTETLKREHYLIGGGEAAPGVGPFTNATADLVVASLFNLIRGYRRLGGDFRADNIWHDFVHLSLYSNVPPRQTPDCFCCGSRGLLMKKEEEMILDTPALGAVSYDT